MCCFNDGEGRGKATSIAASLAALKQLKKGPWGLHSGTGPAPPPYVELVRLSLPLRRPSVAAQREEGLWSHCCVSPTCKERFAARK